MNPFWIVLQLCVSPAKPSVDAELVRVLHWQLHLSVFSVTECWFL